MEIGACNILRKDSDGLVRAFNSDYLGVKSIISGLLSRPSQTVQESGIRSVAVIGQESAIRSVAVIGQGSGIRSVAVIGQGGAGRAALCAARSLGLETSVIRHWELGVRASIEADLVIYTLPRRVDGIENLRARFLLEANYLDPCLSDWKFGEYIPGEVWLKAQAEEGFGKML